jgi:hypothetical protein
MCICVLYVLFVFLMVGKRRLLRAMVAAAAPCAPSAGLDG